MRLFFEFLRRKVWSSWYLVPGIPVFRFLYWSTTRYQGTVQNACNDSSTEKCIGQTALITISKLLVRNTASRHIIDSSSIPVVSSVCLIFHMSNNDEFWIYHERQQAALCGQHALNNLVQAAVFNAQGLAEIAMQLDQIELDYMAQNNEGGVKYVSTCFGFNLFCFYMC